MNDYLLAITHHGYKRYRQRVGSMDRRTLTRRSQTALQIGLYRHGHGVIKLCGIWWGYAVNGQTVVLTTCYGHQQHDMIKERERHAL